MLYNLSVPLSARGQSKAKETDKSSPIISLVQRPKLTSYIITEINDWYENTGEGNDA